MDTKISLDDLDNWADAFLGAITHSDTATVICLSGEVGAGKTTLTQAFARSLGIQETVNSPTFVIQKEYTVERHEWIQTMVHIDAYRLDTNKDLEYLGWNDLIQKSRYVVIIEWPEQVEGISLPDTTIRLHLSINDDHTRTIKKI